MDSTWVDELYAKTEAFWESHAVDFEAGYAIFYSPIHYFPKIMIIGYNPGGDKNSFDRKVASQIPETHDYFSHINSPKEDYPLAKKMRHIFESAQLTDYLKQSVKLNLYFFRTKKAVDLKDGKHIREFFHPKIKEIIDRLRPHWVITEGFKTFRELLNLLDEKEVVTRKNAVRPLVRYGNGDTAKIIGLRHPTGSHGIRTDDLIEMGKAIKATIDISEIIPPHPINQIQELLPYHCKLTNNSSNRSLPEDI